MVWLAFFNFIHFIGLAWGLGGATCATIISVKAEKNKELNKLSMEVMPIISKLIFAGLILLIISGLVLPYLISWPMDKNMLIAKHILVAWILVVGIILMILSKKIKKLTNKKDTSSQKFHKIRDFIKALSMLNLILWYMTTLLAVFV